jgi:hypothetical protein
MVKISPKSQRIVELKLAGKTNTEIGAIEYPNATQESQIVLVSRELKKQAVAQYYNDLLGQSKAQVISSLGITWKKAIQPFVDALQATKTEKAVGEVVNTRLPDHSVRMAAGKQLQAILESSQPTTEHPPNPTIKEAIKDLLKEDVNEITLQQAVFKKVNQSNKEKEIGVT